MVKKLLKSIFILFVLAALFSGCSSNMVEEDVAPVVESDEGAQASQEVTEEQEVTNIVEDELVVEDEEVEIGDLI